MACWRLPRSSDDGLLAFPEFVVGLLVELAESLAGEFEEGLVVGAEGVGGEGLEGLEQLGLGFLERAAFGFEFGGADAQGGQLGFELGDLFGGEARALD